MSTMNKTATITPMNAPPVDTAANTFSILTSLSGIDLPTYLAL